MIRLRRPATDDEAILQLVNRELLPHSHLIASREQLLKEIPERLSEGPTYVAVNRVNRTVGFVHVYVRENTLIVDMLAVAQTSQHRGLGRQLLKRAEQYGRHKRCAQARIMVDYGNVRAERFYEHSGYRFIRFVPAVICHEMGKQL